MIHRITLALVAWTCLMLSLPSASQAGSAVHMDSPPHDCCWGEGCSLSAGVHQNETLTSPVGCSNHHIPGGIRPTTGRCDSDYVGPSRVELTCDTDGCLFRGNFRCTGPGYPVHPMVYLPCDAKVINGVRELPAVSGDNTIALCVYSDGTGYSAECNSFGGVTSGPL